MEHKSSVSRFPSDGYSQRSRARLSSRLNEVSRRFSHVDSEIVEDEDDWDGWDEIYGNDHKGW